MKLANGFKDKTGRRRSNIYIFQANSLLITRFSIVLSALYTSIAMEAPVYTPMSALAIGP